jgi:hypothetical protein
MSYDNLSSVSQNVWNFISSLPLKRGGSLSLLVGTIHNVLVMEISWTDVGSGGYILVSCAHSNTSFFIYFLIISRSYNETTLYIKIWKVIYVVNMKSLLNLRYNLYFPWPVQTINLFCVEIKSRINYLYWHLLIHLSINWLLSIL